MRYSELGRLAEFESTFPRYLRKKYITDLIYPAVGEGGRFFPLFKVLLTNKCTKNCYYCANRVSRNTRREEFKPDELANLFLRYFKSGWACGLFLSSGIHPSPNAAQEKMLEVIKLLRTKYKYNGYIHCKLLPGADPAFIPEIVKYSDRMSINLEFPGEKFMEAIAPEKRYSSELISGLSKLSEFAGKLKYGITTQFVVGLNVSDKELLFYVEHLYKKYNLRRVYYSGFVPVSDTPLDSKPACHPLREFRLYQADFLIRKYGFQAKEFVYSKDGNLPLKLDPKSLWAMNNPQHFPVELNSASYEQLIRVPGIGPVTAKKILKVRRESKLSAEGARKLGVILSRAAEFITIGGKKVDLQAKPPSAEQMFLWENL